MDSSASTFDTLSDHQGKARFDSSAEDSDRSTLLAQSFIFFYFLIPLSTKLSTALQRIVFQVPKVSDGPWESHTAGPKLPADFAINLSSEKFASHELLAKPFSKAVSRNRAL